MSYTAYINKTFASIKSHDSVEKSKLINSIEKSILIKEKKSTKGIINGVIYSMPVWFLVISLAIWLI